MSQPFKWHADVRRTWPQEGKTAGDGAARTPRTSLFPQQGAKEQVGVPERSSGHRISGFPPDTTQNSVVKTSNHAKLSRFSKVQSVENSHGESREVTKNIQYNLTVDRAAVRQPGVPC